MNIEYIKTGFLFIIDKLLELLLNSLNPEKRRLSLGVKWKQTLVSL